MANSISISNSQEINVVEYNGERVLTLKQIDQIHQRKEGTARFRFNDNKTRFKEGKHFYLIDYSQKCVFRPFGINIPPRGLIVVTERGYLLLVKSFTDDLSWQVQEQLIDVYFRVKEVASNQYEKMSSQQAKALLNEIHHAFYGWAFGDAEKAAIYNRIRAENNISNFEDLPANRVETVKAMIKQVQQMNKEFLGLLMALRKHYSQNYIGAGAPWTPDLKRKWQKKFDEELPTRPNWLDVRRKLTAH